jgi:hypothetical protein
MMRFRIETKLNDGMAEAPAMEIEVEDTLDVLDAIEDELVPPIDVGATITIERLA